MFVPVKQFHAHWSAVQAFTHQGFLLQNFWSSPEPTLDISTFYQLFFAPLNIT